MRPGHLAVDSTRHDDTDAVLDRLVVADALAELGPAQREVIVLVDVLGLPLSRAADRLGIGERAAKSRLHRARRALAATIGSRDDRLEGEPREQGRSA